jgi:hypothetical protein
MGGNTAKGIIFSKASFACVKATVDNKHIHVSENILVESIAPGKGIRYTAVIKADNRLKDGTALIRIGVLHNNKPVNSQTREFTLQTAKR